MIFESLLWKWLITFKIQIINSSGFKITMSEEVKGFFDVSKTSINYSKALISIVSRLKRAFIFLKISLLIPKRFRDYSVAKLF